MQITTCSDASGRSVTFSSKKFHATALAGLLPIAHIARSLNLFKAAKEVLSDAVPSKLELGAETGILNPTEKTS